MTKDIYLKSILSKKKSWQYAMPIFEQQNIHITIDSDTVYQSTLPILVQEGALFECYIESLKNIVQVKSPWITYLDAEVEFYIDPVGLCVEYTYEDRLTIYYPGGMTYIYFSIEKKEKLNKQEFNTSNTVMSIQDDKVPTHPSISKTPFKLTDNTSQDEIHSMSNLLISGLKRTYHPKETIRLKVLSRIPKQVPITFIMSNDWVVPNRLELFVHEEWTQEWYVKKSSIEHILSRWIGKYDHEKEITLSVFIGDDREEVKTFSLVISPFEPYLTSIVVIDEREYRATSVECLSSFRSSQLKTFEVRNMKEKFMACLNYDQQNFSFRVMYILFLMEYESKKSAREEYLKLIKNSNKNELLKYKDGIEGLEALLTGSKDTIEVFLQRPMESEEWITPVIRLFASEMLTHEFSRYEGLYSQGAYSCFLIARCVDFLNSTPVLPRGGLSFYCVCLQWALSHDCISDAWLLKIDKFYYVFEKEEAFSFHLAYEVFKRYNSLFLLRLACSKSISAHICTVESHELYEKALQSKLYIQHLEQAYIEACYLQKIAPRIEHIVYKSSYTNAIKEFLFVEIIKERLAFPVIYRRIYKEIVSYMSDLTDYTSEAYHIYRLLFHELIEENPSMMSKLFQSNHIQSMYHDVYGLELLNAMLHLCFTVNKYVSVDTSTLFIQNIVRTIGFEGIARCYGNTEVIHRFVLMNDTYQLNELIFLPNSLYCDKLPEETAYGKLIIKLLCDASVEEVVSLYEICLYEKNMDTISNTGFENIEEPFYDYLGAKIVNDHFEISEALFLRFYDFCFRSSHPKIGYIYALLKSLPYLDSSDDKIAEKIYAMAKKHDIILPWKKHINRLERTSVIEFLSNEHDQIKIHYRYPSEETFSSAYMKHVGFGTFIFHVQLFYGEYFEYFIEQIVYEHRQIPVSEIIEKKVISEDGRYNVENNYQNSVECFNYEVSSQLDQIAQSFELDDFQSGKMLEEELKDHIKRVTNIPRI